jgi:hypothetical protein
MTKYGASLPLKIKRHANSLAIVDAAERAVAHVYFEQETTRRGIAKLLSPDEAEEVAKLIARTVTLAIEREGEG